MMENFQYYAPTKVVFGKGTENKAGQLVKEQNCRKVGYDGSVLTPDKLRTQIRSYYGLKDIIAQRGLDFIGIKAHGDLTEYYCTMDLAEAFLNDPYDWDAPRSPSWPPPRPIWTAR